MGKECGAWVSRRLWGGGNTIPLKTTAWEANGTAEENVYLRVLKVSNLLTTITYLHLIRNGRRILLFNLNSVLCYN